MKTKINYLLIVLVGIISTIIGIGSVNAADDVRYAYKGDTIWYGDYGTYNKRLCKSSSVSSSCDGEIAYCIQSTKESPESKTRYVLANSGYISLSQAKMLGAGYIINQINAKDLSAKDKYAYTYIALNKYLNGAFSSIDNSTITKLVDGTPDKVKSLWTSSGFDTNPIVSITSNGFSSNKNGDYYYTKITITANKVDKLDSKITYTVNVTGDDSITLWSNSALTTSFKNGSSFEYSSTDKTGNFTQVFYVKIPKDATEKVFNVKVSASSTTSYKYVNIWKPVDSSNNTLTGKQGLVTITEKPFKHSATLSRNFSVPNNKEYEFTAVKVDETGTKLTGSKLKASVARTTEGNCTVDKMKSMTGLSTCEFSSTSKTSCSVPPFDIAQGGTTQFCMMVEETTTPSGYIKGAPVVKFVDFSTREAGSDSWYFNYNDNSGEITEKEFNSEFITDSDGYCKTTDGGKIIKDISSDKCVDSIPETPEVTPSTPEQEEEQNLPEQGDSGQEQNPPVNPCADGGCVVGEFVSGPVCLAKYGEDYSVAKDLKYGSNTVSPCNEEVKFSKVSLENGNHLIYEFQNKKISVNISKQDISGNEVTGAYLKICSKDGDNGYDKKGNDCEAALTSDGDKMSWMSEGYTKNWSSVPVGDYFLIETIAPSGYLKTTTAIEFEVDKDGKVSSGNYDEKSNAIVIKNKLNEVTISKQDITDKKELPGAKLYICEAEKLSNGTYKMIVDDSNKCVPVILADGTVASWKSEKEPHKIKGLRPGSYYLVEDKAPLGYLDAESIVFTMNADGTISDENGKAIGQNKIVMYDSKNPKTGSVIIIIVATIMVIAGGVAFYFVKKRK